MKILQLLLLILSNPISAEDLYQYTDIAGNLVITNKKIKGSVKMNLPDSITYTTASLSPRYKILQEELDHEKLALEQIQILKVKYSADKDKVNLFNNNITLHQKNIETLNKQLNQDGYTHSY